MAEPLDPYCLDEISGVLNRGNALSVEEQWWLLEECKRLFRANRSLDAREAEHDQELDALRCENLAMHSELADWIDKHAMLEQQMQALRYSVEYYRARENGESSSHIDADSRQPVP